jgi:hypothetical protein
MHRFLHLNLKAAAVLLGVLAGCVAPAGVRAQSYAPSPVDATAIVRRAVANHLTAEKKHHPMRFVLHKKDERRDYIQEIIETGQGDVAMAIAANGALLSPTMRQVQMDRLNNLDAHPELQEHRRKREAEDNARVDKLMRMLPEAFVYHYDATVPCMVTVQPSIPLPGGALPEVVAPPPAPVTASQCYHLTFRPNPRWDPPDTESRILRGMAGDVLLEKSQERLTRLNARLITDVDFGWGIIGHLDKGGTIFLEQTLVGQDDWELTRMKLNLTGKALMVKSLNYHVTEEMGHYSPVGEGLDYHQAIRMLKAEPVR